MAGIWAEVSFWSAAIVVIIASLVGVVLTVVTLPGTWVMLLVALLTKVWEPGLLSWWTLGIGAGLVVLGEVIEFVSSAAGSKRAGGSRAGGWGSLVGALVGMVAGTVFLAFLPLIGSVIGAVIGAGLGAAIAERGLAERTWGDSYRSGQGAAVGRMASIVIKGGIAGVIALMLCVDAVWN